MRLSVSSTQSVRPLGPQVVEHEQVGLDHRAQDIPFFGPIGRIVGAANQLQQVARVVEDAARAFGADDLPEDGDGQVRLADAGWAEQEQAAIDDGERIGQTLPHAPSACFSLSLIRLERARDRSADSVWECAQSASSVSPTFARQQSQRVTRCTPSISTGFQPVPSQRGQVTN